MSNNEAPPPITVRVLSRNSQGLLRQMSDVFAVHGVNILRLNAQTTADFKSECTFGVKATKPEQLAKLVAELRRLRDVMDVSLDEPGKPHA